MYHSKINKKSINVGTKKFKIIKIKTSCVEDVKTTAQTGMIIKQTLIEVQERVIIFIENIIILFAYQ